MEGLSEIATTGAPGIVTAMGMGTVFACLILLYVFTRVMGSAVPRFIAMGEARNRVVTASADASAESTQQPLAAAVDGVAAAITLALVRHRTARVVSAPEEPRDADPWKIAGRVHALRDQ